MVGVGFKSFGKFNKDAIADGMAKAIVDTLETIQIDKQK